MQVGKYRDAKDHFEASLSFWLPTNNKNKLSLINNNLGYLALLLGDYYKSHKYLTKAVLLAKESSNLRMQALAIASIGDLLSSLNLSSSCNSLIASL